MIEITLEESRVEDVISTAMAYVEGKKIRKDLLSKAEADYDVLSKEIGNLDLVGSLLRHLLEQKRQEVKSKIEDLVTWGLQTVFEEEYEFFFESSTYGGRVEMKPMLKVGGHSSPIMDFHGGGVVEVTAFLLNLLVLLLARPKLRRVMIMDEMFSMVSSDYLPRVGLLLQELTTRVGVQFILITHLDSLKAVFEKRYQFSKRGSRTIVEVIG